jgi:uncharacterized OB-fold protein
VAFTNRVACPVCGERNHPDVPACQACGARQVGREDPREQVFQTFWPVLLGAG